MTHWWSKQDSNPRSPRTTTRDDRLRSLGGEVLGDERCVRRRVRDIRRRRASFFLDLARKSGSHLTCMGLFLSSGCFGFAVSSLFGAGRPFFVPSPAIRFPERAEGVKGPKR